MRAAFLRARAHRPRAEETQNCNPSANQRRRYWRRERTVRTGAASRTRPPPAAPAEWTRALLYGEGILDRTLPRGMTRGIRARPRWKRPPRRCSLGASPGRFGPRVRRCRMPPRLHATNALAFNGLQARSQRNAVTLWASSARWASLRQSQSRLAPSARCRRGPAAAPARPPPSSRGFQPPRTA